MLDDERQTGGKAVVDEECIPEELMKKLSISKRSAETLKIVLAAVALTLVLRIAVVEAYHVPTGSMEDTILPGDTLLGNKFLFGARLPLLGLRLPAIRHPRPGDVIVFKHPLEKGERLVKRVIAVAGQTVEIKNKQIYVDHQLVQLPENGKYLDSSIRPPGESTRDNMGLLKVPEGRLFVMGDNRDDSIDSRSWGCLPEDQILGKAMIVLYSWEMHKHEPFWQRIRWNRIGQILN